MNHEATELHLYLDNDYTMYQRRADYTATLDKHMRRGRFDRERAITLFSRYAEEAAKKYTTECGSPGDRWYDLFDPACRRQVAEWLVDEYMEEAL